MKIEVENGKINNKYEVSKCGLENKRLDYNTLANMLDGCILNNKLISLDVGYWELLNGTDYSEDEDIYCDVFQYFIISESDFELFKHLNADEIVYYNEELDVYLWGVTHYGTSWEYVLTNIELDVI